MELVSVTSSHDQMEGDLVESDAAMDERSNLLKNDCPAVTQDPDKDTDNEQKTDVKQLETFLKSSGYGFFHVIMLTVVGLATAADAVEIFGISFVLPIAEQDLDLTTADKGWLDASIFMGMLVGGYLWGSLADVYGRKITLMTAMLLNGVCGLVSAFSPNFGFFLVFRFVSGIGVGGSQPIVFSYVSEFFTEKQRGPMIILLAACWQPGIIFTAFMAWALLGIEGPHTEISFYIGSLFFVNWRLFLIICTIPAFVSSISLLFLPETPAYLLHIGKLNQLKKVLKQIYKVNKMCPCCYLKQEYDTTPLLADSDGPLHLTESSPPDSGDEPGQSMGDTDKKECDDKQQPHGGKKCVTNFGNKLKKIVHATVGVFRWKYLRATMLLLIIWFTQSFGYYGLQLWFPEYFKRLQLESIENSTAVIYENSTSTNQTNLQFYQDTLYIAIASLPGNVVGALLINIIGGRIQLAVAMILSALSVFSIWKVPNIHTAVVAVSCVFSAVTVTVFGSLDVVNMNTYDVDVRSTAFGIHSGVGRLGAILGNVMFGHLLDVDRAIPILVVASLLTTGSICAVFLPPIYRPENRPPLVRLLYQIRTKLCTSRKDKKSLLNHQTGSTEQNLKTHESLLSDDNVQTIATTSLSKDW